MAFRSNTNSTLVPWNMRQGRSDRLLILGRELSDQFDGGPMQADVGRLRRSVAFVALGGTMISCPQHGIQRILLVDHTFDDQAIVVAPHRPIRWGFRRPGSRLRYVPIVFGK